jgi:uncharacterized membrane protein YgcG
MNTTVVIFILAFWAVAATAVMIGALRSASQARTTLATVRKDRDKALRIAGDYKQLNRELADAASTPKPAATASSLNRFLSPRPKVPSSRPSTPTSRRDDSSDSLTNALVFGALASTWTDDTPSRNDTSSSSSSYDSGSSSSSYDSGSSSSSDSGSFGGGDSGSF